MGKFKVGDRVRVVVREIFCDRVQVGDEAVVQSVVEGALGQYLDLLFDGELSQSCKEDHVELIEPDAAAAENWDFDPRRELKVGDRVRVTHTDYDGPSLAVGVTGKVARNYGHCFGVVLDVPEPFSPDEDWAFRSDELKLLPPAIVTEPDPDLSVRMVADMSHLDSEIDRILRRLKKVEKKARKLGIRLEFRDAA